MTYPFDASMIVSLIVPPCVMLLVSIGLWSFVRSEMRSSLPMRMFAIVVVLTGMGLASTLLFLLFGTLHAVGIAYQVVTVAFLISSLCVLFRIRKPVAPRSQNRKTPLRKTLRVRPLKVRTYKNPKGRKPNRGRTAYSTGSTFRMC